MAKKNQHILFVSHKANRSGAPLLFLELIQEFKKQTTIPFKILIMEDGELVEDFKALGKTFTWKQNTRLVLNYQLPKFISKPLERISLILHGFYILFCVRSSSLLFFNTIANGHIYRKLLFLKSPSICYVHELEAAIQITTNKKSLEAVLHHTSLFLAPSRAVKAHLQMAHKIEAGKIALAPYSMNDISRDKNDYKKFIDNFKKNNLLSDSTIIIGVLASNEWRKGIDLFVPLISTYFELFPASDVLFVWKGFNNNSLNAYFELYDYKKFDFKDKVLLLPHGSDNIEQLACFDIHLLLSREDPYPLVVLEAASFAIPTVCFTAGGGSSEFVETDAGFSVPYGNLVKMASALNQLAENPILRNKMGMNAVEKLRLRHNRKEASGNIIEIVKKML
jgi:glycosyltransferase involved in cell wall biosynthesis